jgi:hypothetical protein
MTGAYKDIYSISWEFGVWGIKTSMTSTCRFALVKRTKHKKAQKKSERYEDCEQALSGYKILH